MDLIDFSSANAVSVSQFTGAAAHSSQLTGTAAHPSPPADDSSTTQRDLAKQQRTLYARLGELRNLNRNAILQVRETKQLTAEARQEIDRLHLHLQNLYYEERHLRGEIAACESYELVGSLSSIFVSFLFGF